MQTKQEVKPVKDVKETTDVKRPVTKDVIQLLHADHQKVANLFFQFTQAEEDSEKEELVSTIITELSVHAKVEEEIVYPAIRSADKENEDIMDEADTEHHVVKFLLAELSSMKAKDDFYCSKVTVLCELVNHHVQEEEKEIFEKLEKSGANLEELAVAVLARKKELMSAAKPTLKNSMTENSRTAQEAGGDKQMKAKRKAA